MSRSGRTCDRDEMDGNVVTGPAVSGLAWSLDPPARLASLENQRPPPTPVRFSKYESIPSGDDCRGTRKGRDP
jgi:hypothetical protein